MLFRCPYRGTFNIYYILFMKFLEINLSTALRHPLNIRRNTLS